MADDQTYSWTAKALRGYQSFRRKFQGLTFSGNVRVTQTPGGLAVHVPVPEIVRPTPPRPPENRLVQVVEANVGADPPPHIHLVKNFDAAVGAVTGDAFPVVSPGKRTTANRFYIHRPTNGLLGNPMYEDEPVRWREIPPAGLLPCTVVKDGGEMGTEGGEVSEEVVSPPLPPTATYAVTDVLTGQTVGTHLSPACNRAPGLNEEAEHGTYYYDADGNPVLWWVDEQPVITTECTDDEEETP